MIRLPTTPTLVAAVSTVPVSSDLLTVYIEGDGYAWRTREWPSVDPSPLDPVALRLAAQHGPSAVAWLSRPCQYVDAPASACPSTYWTSGRYGVATTTLIHQALDELKRQHHAKRLVLVGYSGGGTVAASVAAHRTDVDRLVTVAANLDLDQWTQHHGLPSFPPEHNPANLNSLLGKLPQVHLVGLLDKVVPPSTVRAYAAHMDASSTIQIIEVAQADHTCCWADLWPELKRSALQAVP